MPVGGFSGFVFDGTEWGTTGSGAPRLSVELHDSDIAVVSIVPSYGATGTSYLGFQPRDYFDNPDASPVIDLDAEAAALVRWVAEHGRTTAEVGAVRALLAEEGVDELTDDFVEDTVAELLQVLGLPLPPELEQ